MNIDTFPIPCQAKAASLLGQGDDSHAVKFPVVAELMGRVFPIVASPNSESKSLPHGFARRQQYRGLLSQNLDYSL